MNRISPADPGRPVRPLSPDELRSAFDKVLDRDAPPGLPHPSPAAISRTVTSAGIPKTGGAAPATPALEMAPLMGLDDREFVEQAYAGVLKRQPDEQGFRHHVAALAAGHSRISVLGELRYSAEGRAAGVMVPGLRRRFQLHRAYRIPVLGRLLRSLTALLAVPGLMRDVARLGVDLRALRGHTEQADSAIEREMRSRSDHVEHLIERERQAGRDHDRRLAGLALQMEEDRWVEPVLALAERCDAQALLLDRLDSTVRSIAGDRTPVAELGEALSALREEFGLAREGAASLAHRLRAVLDDARNASRRAVATAEENRVGLCDQERRFSLMLGEVRRWIAHGVGPDAADQLEAQQDHLLDPLYLAFEDRFRGTRADIKGRQSVYLELLREAGAGQPGRPIVDVGSGRGELLELLGEQGMQARGVDLNRSMVAYCQGAGLDCTLDDAVAYLSGLEAGSLGAVTGFHIIEHLPFTTLVALLDASLRALAPGGVVVFETPNPANLLVASRWFHLDPTHRNPLPGEMISMIAEARGFVQVGIRELHPMARRFEARDEVLAAQLDAIFHGPQDYALIARKP